MRWTGHLTSIEDDKLPKRLFYAELIQGNRPSQKPKKRFKDVVQSVITYILIFLVNWSSSLFFRISYFDLKIPNVKNIFFFKLSNNRKIAGTNSKDILTDIDLHLLPFDIKKSYYMKILLHKISWNRWRFLASFWDTKMKWN